MDCFMNVQAIALGVISLIACFILFFLEMITPKNERVHVTPFFTYSHEWVHMQIIFLSIIGAILIVIGLVF
jgi:archaellum biogenesis protein FlaJ (TadC family)